MINLLPEVVTKARNLGLNISKVSENALIDIIRRIEGSNPQNNPENGGTGTAGSVMVDRTELA